MIKILNNLDLILKKRLIFYKNLIENFNEEITRDANIVAKSIKETAIKNGKIIIFGNGGSHAQSSHLATELLIRFKKNSNRKPIPAYAISSDSSVITACGNDFDFKYIFKKQLESLLNSNDCVIGFSTSGTSENVLEGIKESIKNLTKNRIFLITGFLPYCEFEKKISIIRTPLEGNTEMYQEFHLLMIHLICNILEHTYV